MKWQQDLSKDIVSAHPGPKFFIENIDKNKWEVVSNCCLGDWGIGFVWKKLS